jgi:spore maturation protein CgeB
MRFLILDTGYPDFLEWLYAHNPGLEGECYDRQARVRAESLFGQGSFYAANLRRLGHEAWDIEANNERLQRAWAREHGVSVRPAGRWQPRLRRGFVPWIGRADGRRWIYEILAEQIRQYRPDVLFNYSMELDSAFFREVKASVRVLVGHHASPLPHAYDFGVYDVMLSLVDNFVDYFRGLGLKSELLRQGFEPDVLSRLDGATPSIAVSFVGNLHSHHASRTRWLEALCERLPLEVWTPSTGRLPAESPIVRCHRGSVWGVEMYQILHRSSITLNHHIDVAGRYAGNIRLFEATGVGTLLITDWKENLHEIFELGTEVVAYRTVEECAEMVSYYLEHVDEGRAIARAGQRRTLGEHTYRQRMQQVVEIVGRHM